MNVPAIRGRRARFVPHTGFASNGLSTIEQFAEHLSNGLTVPEASRAMGIYPGYGNSLLQRIRKQLGPQAR